MVSFKGQVAFYVGYAKDLWHGFPNHLRAGPGDLGATAIMEIDTEFERDAQALFEKNF